MTLAHSSRIFVPTRRLVLPGDLEFEWEDKTNHYWEGRIGPEWWSRPFWRGMLGGFPVPERGVVRLWDPSGTGASGTGSAQHMVEMPKNDSFAMLFAISGGGSGGAGRTDVAATQRQGGGGGSTGTLSRCIFPLRLLPGLVWLRVGRGGDGSAGGGAAGFFSFWSVGDQSSPNADTAASLLTATPGIGGTVGATGAGAAAASGSPVAATAGFWATNIGFGYQTLTGLPGGAGGRGDGAAAGLGSAYLASNIFHGGTGGGQVSGTNVEGVGGSYTAPAGFPMYVLPGGVIGGGPGSNGYAINPNGCGNDPFYSIGGTGGGGNAGGVGGAGGQGGWGSGGGGGGAGTTGGRSGGGGHGLGMMITM